jgi:hypothetical protein
LEVKTGFEPVYTALQAATSPLGHSTRELRTPRPGTYCLCRVRICAQGAGAAPVS